MILELEKQVVNLELAKRMKELGAPSGTLYFWYVHDLQDTDKDYKNCLVVGDKHNSWNYPEVDWTHYPAYTVAELGEILPMELDGELYFETCRYWKKIWVCEYRKNGRVLSIAHQSANTEADSRAKMWIHLKENNLI